MDNKDKLISRQVALKGAIELACHSDMYFETLDEVLATAEIIQNFIPKIGRYLREGNANF